MWKKTGIIIMLLILGSCAGPKYKIGDCFLWNHSPDIKNQIYNVGFASYDYYRLNWMYYPMNTGIKSIDKNTSRSMCPGQPMNSGYRDKQSRQEINVPQSCSGTPEQIFS